ncbi:Cathepsin_L [Hexamita inflata]|uniref:Cathepsin L n=1 Tax=Hexamita inflata TaxID=28002 RepID=A0AA86NVQ7_9EUKA|nr:Cathepsin L [Hexamita inflata]
MSVLMRRENTLIIEPGSDISKIQIINFILLPNSKKHFEGPPLYEYLCYTSNSDLYLHKIHSQIDFRQQQLITTAKHQLSCGSCWAFATVAVLENAILIKKQFYSEPFNPSTLNLSELFLMGNLRGINNFCKGGEFSAAVNYLWFRQDTVELESNYPYNMIETVREKYANGIELKPILKQLEYEIPIYAQNKQFPVIGVHPDTSKKFTQNDIKIVKSLLSRGVAVAGSMLAAPYDKLTFYNGNTWAHESCISTNNDHQIVFAGYGKKNGVDVWIIKNSWGADWGSNGFLYVPIGLNSFCIETYAFVINPKHLDFGLDQNFELVDKNNNSYLDNDQVGELVDNDGKYSGIPKVINYKIIISITVGSIIVIAFIVWFTLTVVRIRKSKEQIRVWNKRTIYRQQSQPNEII